MKEHPLQILTIKDLIKFNSYIKKNYIKGRVVQNDFTAKASSFMGIALALPLEFATLIIDDDCVQTSEQFAMEVKYVWYEHYRNRIWING